MSWRSPSGAGGGRLPVGVGVSASITMRAAGLVVSATSRRYIASSTRRSPAGENCTHDNIRPPTEPYLAYSNFGIAFRASFVAPARTDLAFVLLELGNWDRHVVLAHSEESTRTDDRVGERLVGRNDQVVDHADLLILVVVDWLAEDLFLGAPPTATAFISSTLTPTVVEPATCAGRLLALNNRTETIMLATALLRNCVRIGASLRATDVGIDVQ
jgi:hypothetical protein